MLEDRLDALELLVKADNAATARDASAYVALFTDDGVLDGAKGEYRREEALLGAVSAIWASEGTASSHLTLNAVIENVDGAVDEAMATSTIADRQLDFSPASSARRPGFVSTWSRSTGTG